MRCVHKERQCRWEKKGREGKKGKRRDEVLVLSLGHISVRKAREKKSEQKRCKRD